MDGSLFAANRTIYITIRNQSVVSRKKNEPLKIIPNKESAHFLGLTLDCRLNWEKHVDRVRVIVKRALSILKVGRKLKSL